MEKLYEKAIVDFQMLEEVFVTSVWLIMQIFGFACFVFVILGFCIMIYEWIKNRK